MSASAMAGTHWMLASLLAVAARARPRCSSSADAADAPMQKSARTVNAAIGFGKQMTMTPPNVLSAESGVNRFFRRTIP